MASDDGIPVLVESFDNLELSTAGGSNAIAFRPVAASDTSIDESWLQRLVFRYPQLLPITELDQVFAPIHPLAREVSTGVGSIDLLGVSPSGFLTIVETKLYRNPQSCREVVGQILDYCAQLSSWTYRDLTDAMSSAKHRSNDNDDPVLFAAKSGAAVPGGDEKRFRATVSECLRHGRFLMMIVGDGFKESTTELVDYLQRFMHLQFTVRLIELQLFRPAGKDDYPVLVVPRLTARTQEVTRAIVRIQHNVNPLDVVIENAKDQSTSPGLEGFIEILRATTRVADEFASLAGELEPLGIYADPTKDGISFRWPDPHGTGQQFRIFRARRNGHARFGVLASQLEKQGYNRELALRFVRIVADWMRDVSVLDTGAIVGPNGKAKDVPLHLIVKDHRDDFLAAVKRLLDDIRSANENP
jgi:hypothetical protein